MDILYTATATATAGREGKVSTDDNKISMGLSVPKGMGGPGGDGTNPEQLFACGYAACFGGALKMVAAQMKVATGEVRITAKVAFGKPAGGGFGLAVELVGHVAAQSPEKTLELMQAAHRECPYSKATRNNIEVKLRVG